MSARLDRRRLGETGLEVTPLALAFGSVRGSAPKGPALTADDVENAYHQHGINTFFVPAAHKVVIEGVRRLIEAGHRDDLVLVGMASLPFGRSVVRSWGRHAEALGVERLDVFLLGWIQARWYLTGRTWGALRRLKEQGMVRAIGWSIHKRPLAARLAREFEPDVMMIRYNAAHRGAETDVFEELGSDCPAILAYTATRWGRLLQPVPEAGFDEGLSAATCYRFALSHPAVAATMCAARSGDELAEDVAGVLEGPIPPERMEYVRSFGDAVHADARGGQRWMFR